MSSRRWEVCVERESRSGDRTADDAERDPDRAWRQRGRRRSSTPYSEDAHTIPCNVDGRTKEAAGVGGRNFVDTMIG
ncbi:hypothetical protein [Streptomyces sp. NPDC046805]|uniref:hypothetical protein n=1 Tax=Streptomyces sp. NPDC046805 TaxID=3155134 RepID=UPI00340BC66C